MSDTARKFVVNPALDLVLERVVDVPVELVWEAWTTPKHICEWFCPKPYYVSDCDIDLRPGGIFRTAICAPDGTVIENNAGCVLEVVHQERFVFTDALQPGFRPGASPFMTGIIELESLGSSTRYTATVLHSSEGVRNKHKEMGFEEGWGKALEQLVALMKTVAASR